MYERLTHRMSDGTAVFAEKSKSFYSAQIYEEAREKNAQILNRLCDLEDKIEQGEIVELPCNVGDTIWEVWAGGSDITEIQRGVRAIKVDLIYINQYDTILHCISQEMTGHIPLSDFGKTLFLTPEEAEAKLREMEGDNNEQRKEKAKILPKMRFMWRTARTKRNDKDKQLPEWLDLF